MIKNILKPSDIDITILELLSAKDNEPINGNTAFQKEMFLF